MKPRIGIYSGTFDPVHRGHMAFAKEAMRVCSLDEVILLPEQKPRGKSNVTSMAHRVAMLDGVTKATPHFRVMQLASGQFSVRQTLPELWRHFSNARLTFLVGSDIVRTFPYRWEGLQTLLRQVSFAIGLRSGDESAEIAKIMNRLSHDYDVSIDYALIAAPKAGIASSHIRTGMADLSCLHPSTLKYMREHRLYTPKPHAP